MWIKSHQSTVLFLKIAESEVCFSVSLRRLSQKQCRVYGILLSLTVSKRYFFLSLICFKCRSTVDISKTGLLIIVDYTLLLVTKSMLLCSAVTKSTFLLNVSQSDFTSNERIFNKKIRKVTFAYFSEFLKVDSLAVKNKADRNYRSNCRRAKSKSR